MPRRASISIALIGLFITAGLGGCDNKPETTTSQAEQAIPVRVAMPQPAPDADAVSAYGIVRPGSEAELSFKISGLIQAIHVDNGDEVRQGQVLAELDMRGIDSQAAGAALAVQKAKRDVDRMAPLAAKGFASTQRMDDARTALDTTRAEQRAIEFDRSLARITAPADGTVLKRHADSREIIAVGAPVLTVSNGDGSYVLKAGLGDRDIARVKIGDAATIRLDAFDGVELQGRVSRVAAASDPRSGAFETEISFVETNRPLISGFMGEVRIHASVAGTNANALAIPASAILEGHGAQASVFMIDSQTGKAHRRRITVGKLDGDKIIVTGGLAADALVVTAGAAYLRDGVSVRIAEEIAAAP